MTSSVHVAETLKLIYFEVILTPAQRRTGPHSYSKEESLKGIQPTSIVLPAFLECVTTAVVKKKETKQMRMLWPLAE